MGIFTQRHKKMAAAQTIHFFFSFSQVLEWKRGEDYWLKKGITASSFFLLEAGFSTCWGEGSWWNNSYSHWLILEISSYRREPQMGQWGLLGAATAYKTDWMCILWP